MAAGRITRINNTTNNNNNHTTNNNTNINNNNNNNINIDTFHHAIPKSSSSPLINNSNINYQHRTRAMATATRTRTTITPTTTTIALTLLLILCCLCDCNYASWASQCWKKQNSGSIQLPDGEFKRPFGILCTYRCFLWFPPIYPNCEFIFDLRLSRHFTSFPDCYEIRCNETFSFFGTEQNL